MNYALSFQEHPKPADLLIVFIGDKCYRIAETEDGQLKVSKLSDDDNKRYPMQIIPVSTNAIIIT